MVLMWTLLIGVGSCCVWPCPSVQELLEAWEASVPEAERETVGKKTITKPEFEATEIWLDHPLEEFPACGRVQQEQRAQGCK